MKVLIADASLVTGAPDPGGRGAGRRSCPAAIADPVTGGKTVLKFDQATGEGFADMSIGIDTTGAAKERQARLQLPDQGRRHQHGPEGHDRPSRAASRSSPRAAQA